MPAMRLALTAPMWGVSAGGREKDGIADVMQLMNDYSLTRCARGARFRHPGKQSALLTHWYRGAAYSRRAVTTGRRCLK
jgi:hypothetical protein